MSIKIALLGLGTVGSQVARILLEEKQQLKQRVGQELELVKIVVRELQLPRYVTGDEPVDPSLITDDAYAAIDASDVVIELIGGLESAKTFIEYALEKGKNVVTGNKALIADSGAQLLKKAADHAVQLSYEAAVAGAIPILRPIQDNLAGDNIIKVMGIVNGTTNYILDQMDVHGVDFSAALAGAKEAGYAEADPTADIEGYDAASKAAILARLAFHVQVPIDMVYREGIVGVTAADIAAARQAGYAIKLLAICEKHSPGRGKGVEDQGLSGISVRVHPTLVSRDHPLASVHGAFNAVFVEAENAGEIMFYGQGAGGAPTASAIMGDTVTIARSIVQGHGDFVDTVQEDYPVLEAHGVTTSYAITTQAADEPGVLAQIAGGFARNGVSLETIRQEKNKQGALIYIVTHRAKDSVLRHTVQEIEALDVIDDVISTTRVE